MKSERFVQTCRVSAWILGTAASIPAIAYAVTRLPLTDEQIKATYALATFAIFAAVMVVVFREMVSFAVLPGALVGLSLGWVVVFFHLGHLTFLGPLVEDLEWAHTGAVFLIILAQIGAILVVKLVSWPLVRALRAASRRRWQASEYDTNYVWKTRTGEIHGRVSRTDLARLGLGEPRPTSLDAGTLLKVLAWAGSVVAGYLLLRRWFDLELASLTTSIVAWLSVLVVPTTTARLARWWPYQW